MKIPKLDWPDEKSEVECLGFSEGILYDLIFAIDHDRVSMVSLEKNGWYFAWTFDFLGFRYQLSAEEPERGVFRPYRLQKLARLGVDDDGETIVEESFTSPSSNYPSKSSPKYEGAWGAF